MKGLGHRDAQLLTRYLVAKECVTDAGFRSEIDWQDRVASDTIDESTLLREAAWAILSSGLSERIVRLKFPEIAIGFGGFGSAAYIVRNACVCRARVLQVFNHPGKIDAILEMSGVIASRGHRALLEEVGRFGPSALQGFKYLGPVTSRHLAKNLGFPCAKPDRHLVRLARSWGVKGADALCSTIARLLGEKVSVVDVVLWRYCVIQASTRRLLMAGCPK